MKKLEMTNSEIVKSYNNAEQKGIQITILAELNDTTNAHIKSILRDAGVELPRGPLPKTKKEEKPVIEIVSAADVMDTCEGGVCELRPKKPMSKEVWLMARQVELKAYLADQLNAMNEVDLELVAEYNEMVGGVR